MKVECVKQSLGNFNGNLAEKCAKLYCQIWKEPPWCENFWKPEKVLSNLKEEVTKQSALCLMATLPSQEVIGFSWGYEVSGNDLVKISGQDQLSQALNGSNGAFYISELGVDAKKRQKGIGRQLTQKLLQHASDCGYGKIILRTDIRAVPARALYASLGFNELPAKDAVHQSRSYWLLQT